MMATSELYAPRINDTYYYDGVIVNSMNTIFEEMGEDGGLIFTPSGEITLSGPYVVPRNTTIAGAGKYLTKLLCTGTLTTTSGYFGYVGTDSTTQSIDLQCVLKDFTAEAVGGISTSDYSYAVTTSAGRGFIIDSVFMKNFGRCAVSFNGVPEGYWVLGRNFDIYRSRFENCGNAVSYPMTRAYYCKSIRVQSNYIYSSTQAYTTGFAPLSSYGLTVIGNHMKQIYGGINLGNCYGGYIAYNQMTNISEPMSQGNTSGGLYYFFNYCSSTAYAGVLTQRCVGSYYQDNWHIGTTKAASSAFYMRETCTSCTFLDNVSLYTPGNPTTSDNIPVHFGTVDKEPMYIEATLGGTNSAGNIAIPTKERGLSAEGLGVRLLEVAALPSDTTHSNIPGAMVFRTTDDTLFVRDTGGWKSLSFA